MAQSQILSESMLIELAGKSFQTFCDDISGMFGIDIQCTPQQVTPVTVNGLQERFQDLSVLYTVNAEGVLNGTFQLVFDRQGLFILAGIVDMKPEQTILEDTKSGSLEKAQNENSILKEVGAALTGSWDRIFRKALDGRERFTLTDTFIGNPWDNPRENIGLAPDEQVTFVPYEMTVGPFPNFKCGIIFKKEFLAGTPRPDIEQPAPDQEKARQKGGDKTQEETENRDTNVSEGMQDTKEADQDETVTTKQSAATQETEAAAEQKPDVVQQQPATTTEADKEQDRPISDAIKKLIQSPAASSDESIPSTMQESPSISHKDQPLAVCAKDIMQKDIIWTNPEDSVQHALAKIQKNDAGYLMIGRGQVLEGIVSKSNLTAALSPYLRSIFAKWRRPLDDATLQIRIKWIMSKTFNSIKPDTPLSEIMERMCLTDLRCLPVVDEQGKVQGLITVFDVLKVFLNQTSLI